MFSYSLPFVLGYMDIKGNEAIKAYPVRLKNSYLDCYRVVEI